MGVSLAEITGIRGDAAIGAGTAGSSANLAQLPADQLGLQLLDSAANARMLANKYFQDQYQQNLKDYYANFNNISVEGLMEKDYDELVPEWAKLANDLADNYDVIMNPSKDLQRYGELKQREAALRGRIAQSKQDQALRSVYGNFISTHPDFRTPENIDRLRMFSELGIGERDRDGLMSVAPRYDAMQTEIAKAANLAAQQKTKEQDTANPFQTTTERTTYFQQAYDEAVRQQLSAQDAFNRPMLNAVEDIFKRQPRSVQEQYRTPEGTYRVADFGVERVYGGLRNQDDLSITKTPNQFAEIKAQGAESRRNIAAQGAEARKTMAYGKALEDKDITTAASEIPVRQLSVFGLPDDPNARKEQINASTVSSGNAAADKAINDFSRLFGVSSSLPAAPKLEGVAVPLDSWMTNAYSIPRGKTRKIDEDTRQVIEEDSYMRPEKAWVTTEQNPNARKVVIRYRTDEEGGTRDLVLPYTDHLQVLNNVAGQVNAMKMGGAKTRLLRELTGKITPSYEELQAVPLFSRPVVPVGGEQLQGAGPGSSVIPGNPTTGSLNASTYMEQLKKIRANKKK